VSRGGGLSYGGGRTGGGREVVSLSIRRSWGLNGAGGKRDGLNLELVTRNPSRQQRKKERGQWCGLHGAT